MIRDQTQYAKELGKAVADRLGLNVDTTLLEWSADGSGTHVRVTMTTMKNMPMAEYNELIVVALKRAESALKATEGTA